MICSKILVAYDSSDLARKSLEKAMEIAQTDPTIEIEVIYVVTVAALSPIVMDNFQTLVDAIYQEGKDLIDKAGQVLSELPNHSQTYLLEGSPAHLILEHAREHNCDLIIMGSRGLSGIKEFLGSVSHTVVQYSQIPVFIVK